MGLPIKMQRGRCVIGKPDAPEPPDPRETSAAQTGTNIGTAIANNATGMVNQETPWGNLTYNQSGEYTYDDPFTGESYVMPTWTATTSLNPMQEETLSLNQSAGRNLAGVADERSEFLGGFLSQNPDFDTENLENRIFDLGSRRLDPKFEDQREGLRTRLANQGIAPNSEAYNREMELMGQQENDAYNQLFLTGRGQALSQMFAERNQPINEISALLSGSQVSMPGFNQFQPQGAATTDVAGLIGQNYQQQQQNYQQQMAQQQSLMGGLFGLAAGGLSGGMIPSDRRLKKNIRRVGEYGRLPVYSYEYVWGGGERHGFMADDVRGIAPDAVVAIDGYDVVDYAKAMEAAR